MLTFALQFTNNYAKKVVGKMYATPIFYKAYLDNTSLLSKHIDKNKWLCNSHVCHFKEGQISNENKLISISPGGFKGFYMMGTVNYIKDTYPLDNFIFSGASAGAWNALFMTFKGEPLELVLDIIEDAKKALSIVDLEYGIKYKILQKYSDNDFDLKKLYIGVTNFENLKMKTHIYSDFNNLEDAINCCIASSHIPYITGGFKNIYNNEYSFDGGFSKYPYLNIIKPTMHITPDIWFLKQKRTPKNCVEKFLNISTEINKYTTLFSKDKFDFYSLYDNGYNDAKKNKDFLDSIFIRK